MSAWTQKLKGMFMISILKRSSTKIFYRLTLIIWIVMGCGIARFGRRGLKTTENFALSLEVPSDYQGPRGTAQNDKSLKSFISGAAPRNPLALPLETPWRCPSKPLRRPSKPHGAVPRNPRCAAPQNPWGQILRPKFSSFGGF